MQRLVHGLAVLMMVVWTAIVIADLVLSAGSAGWFAGGAPDVAPAGARSLFDSFRADFWSPAAQARAIVWGLPMTAFCLIAALTQRLN